MGPTESSDHSSEHQRDVRGGHESRYDGGFDAIAARLRDLAATVTDPDVVATPEQPAPEQPEPGQPASERAVPAPAPEPAPESVPEPAPVPAPATEPVRTPARAPVQVATHRPSPAPWDLVGLGVAWLALGGTIVVLLLG
jgi:outer membrane biosynthesis protein TonB